MAKNFKDMFSLSPFEYSPSNCLNMSPGEGSSKVAIEIITDDDEPEITFSTIPEKGKNRTIPAEEFQVEILQRIGKLEDLIQRWYEK